MCSAYEKLHEQMHGEVDVALFPLPSIWEYVFWLLIGIPEGERNCVTQYEEYSGCVRTKGLSVEQISGVKGTILNLQPRPNSILDSGTHQINQRQCHRFDCIVWHYTAMVHGLASPLGSFWAQDWIDNGLGQNLLCSQVRNSLIIQGTMGNLEVNRQVQ